MTATTHAFLLKPIAAGVRSRTGLVLGYGALAALPGFALAGPGGEQLAGGAATVARPDASQTVVTQTSQQAVMNWQSFSIAGNEYVKFVQPGTNAAILNRVVGPDLSSIFGRLEANGRVFLVNPRGVYFAPGAQVDVGALAASVLDIRDDDFMNGRYVFSKSANSPDGASVVNAGRISTNGAGGFVALLGDRAENAGLISARLGTVALAAGNKVTLDINQDGLVNLAVDERAVSALAGVKNAGQIVADGGRVVMSAKVADGLAATAVNNAGLVRAHSIEEQGGEIVLAGAGGNVVNSGTLDVAGEQNQAGGEAVVIGDKGVELAPQSVITANGDGAGAGGTVRVIADGHLNFAKDATISAEGGAAGGTGGAVELSGHQSLTLRGNLALGKGGQLFIDPARLKILNDASNPSYGGGTGSASTSFNTVGKTFIENQLKAGTNVSLIATHEIFAAGNMLIDATAGPGAGNLKMGIGNYSGTACGFGVCAGTPTFLPTASGSIHLSGVNIAIKGQFTAQGGTASGDVVLGNIAANGVQISAHGNVSLAALTLNGAGNLTANIAANGGHLTVAGPITANAVPNTGVHTLVKLQGNSVDIAQGATLSGFSGGATSSQYFGGAALNVSATNRIGVAGAVNVSGSYGAFVRLNAPSGTIVTNGAITVTNVQHSGNARMAVDGGTLTLNGALKVQTNASYGSASIDLNAANGIAVTGNMTATGGSATVHAHNNSAGGLLINGNVLASAKMGRAYIDLGNYHGTQGVRINGNLTAVTIGSSNASASIYVHNSGGGPLNIQGNVTATGRSSGAWVDLENWDGGGITVTGNVIATATGSSASIHASNEGPGAIAFGGNLTVSNPGGSGAVDLSNSGGAITVNGSISATGKLSQQVRVDAVGPIAVAGSITATAASSSASVRLRGSQVAVQGAITVHGTGSGFIGGSSSYGGSSFRGPTVDIMAVNGVQLGGAVVATGPSFAGIRVRNVSPRVAPTGAITIAGPMEATGGASGYVAIQNRGAGGIQTVGNGVIAANTGVFLGDSGGGPLSVITRTPTLYLSVGSGGVAPAVALDNRGYTGPTAVLLTPNFLPGQVGRVAQSVPGSSSSSGPVTLGETKFGFGGNAVIVGDFSVKNIYVEVNNGGLAILGSLRVGDTPLDSKLGDDLTIKALQLAVRPDGTHLSLPEYQGRVGVGPNAVFRAQNGIMINAQSFGNSTSPSQSPGLSGGGLSFDDPDTPYVVFQSDGPVITGPITSVNPGAKSFVAQYAAYTPTNPIVVEDQVTSTTGAGFFNETNFKTLPGTTILVGGLSLPGGRQTGKITIGSGGSMNIGDQNILFATTGGVTGLGNVKSTGFVADLELLLAPTSEVFQPPVVNEFSDANEQKDEEERRDQALDLSEGEGTGEGGLVTQQSNKGQLCQ